MALSVSITSFSPTSGAEFSSQTPYSIAVSMSDTVGGSYGVTLTGSITFVGVDTLGNAVSIELVTDSWYNLCTWPGTVTHEFSGTVDYKLPTNIASGTWTVTASAAWVSGPTVDTETFTTYLDTDVSWVTDAVKELSSASGNPALVLPTATLTWTNPSLPTGYAWHVFLFSWDLFDYVDLGDVESVDLSDYTFSDGQEVLLYAVPVTGSQTALDMLTAWTISRIIEEAPTYNLATDPVPANSSTPTNTFLTELSWTSGVGAPKDRISFGLEGAPVLIGEILGNKYILSSTLTAGVVYEWRIDSGDGTNWTTGTTWKFTPAALGPPAPTAQNALATKKRLVAAANNRLWYEDV